MVALTGVQSSISQIIESLPASLVAVFVGGTKGIGAATVKQFAKYTRQPKVYLVGRSQAPAEDTIAECESLNPDGQYTFIQGDVSLINVVDAICNDIRAKESSVNLLFLTAGTLDFKAETSEGLLSFISLPYYSRTRCILNLLPLLQQASSLRRVVTVFIGGKEGFVDDQDLPCRNRSLFAARGHVSSLVTMSLETLHKRAPSVTFIHTFSGLVKTGLSRYQTGVISKVVTWILRPFIYIPLEESGERHLFIATSCKYPADDASGVPLVDEILIAKGIDGEVGSGVYSVGWDGESSGEKVVKILNELRSQGMFEQTWQHTIEEYERITGKGE